MRIVFVISSYGLGHLTRQIALKNSLLKLHPELDITFVISQRQEEMLSSAILTGGNVSIERIPITPQITMDSWDRVDIESTSESYLRYWEWETQIRDDRAWERILYGVDLIINDIEMVHNPIAKKMGIPIVNISNFTWSDILMGLGLEDLAENYAKWESLSSLDLKLPFSTECQSFNNFTEVGILCRKIDWTRVEEIRKNRQENIILLNYTHKSMEVDLEQYAKKLIAEGYVVILPERYIGDMETENIISIPLETSDTHNFYAAADLVVSKIGYGTVSECITSGTPLLYWMRSNYQEDMVMAKELDEYGLGENIPVTITASELIQKIRGTELKKKKAIEPKNDEIAKTLLDYLSQE